MSNISFKKYVDIMSSVAGASTISTRELIGRLYTTNPLIPTNSYVEYFAYQLPKIGTYFGTTSQEYLRALFYFNFVSKLNTTPQKISFARWVDADTAPMIFGSKITASLAEFNGISDGSFTLTLGTTTHLISGLDFTLAANYDTVATIIEDGITAETGLQWTAATVVFQNTTTSLNFVGGDASTPAIVSVSAGTLGTDIMNDIGWGSSAVFSDGILTQTITEVLTASTNASDNFGSFIFIPTLTLDQITEASVWNDAENNLFQYFPPVTQANASNSFAALASYSGLGVVNVEALPTNNYVEMLPMVILASTDFTKANAVQNYMYQQYAAVTPTVTDTTTSDTLDGLRVNYYGQTQTSGQNISFFQTGILMGGLTSATDMGVYANEQWFKAQASAAYATLLIGSPYIPANDQGRGVLLGILQSVIDQALFNGTISVGKNLTAAQKAAITNISNDLNAWYQVQGIGYWADVVITPTVRLDDNNNPITQYVGTYTVIYSKNDSIQKIIGNDILI